jgi:putative NADPH-quinone reductase
MMHLPMEITVVLAHPDPRSFNHAIAQTVCRTLERNGHFVHFHDLYREGFDPLLPVPELDNRAEPAADLAPYCDQLQRSDGLVFVHPNWWGQPPAVMKGWIDRVLRPGVAYQFLAGDSGEGVPVGLLRAQTAMVFNTSNTPPEREMDEFGDPLDRLWKKCILEFCGVKHVARQTFSVVITSTPEQRETWLRQVEEAVAASFADELGAGQRTGDGAGPHESKHFRCKGSIEGQTPERLRRCD